MLQDKPGDARRWPRGQKFSLSAAGQEAHGAYRLAVQEARGVGRGALDAALASWATPLKVQPGDGVLLSELLAKPRGLSDLARALDDAGTSAAEVRGAIDRLVSAGLVEPVPLASQLEQQPAAPAPTRWARS
jgi:hypothetical protein